MPGGEPGELGRAGVDGPGDAARVIAAFVQIDAVYDDGSCGPADAVNVAVTAPAVRERTTRARTTVGGLTALTAAWGDETPDGGETR